MRQVFVPTFIVAVVATTLPTLAQQPKLDLSAKALTNAAIKYVADYEKQFAFLLADEDYRQTLFDADGRLSQTRQLAAELFVTYLPAQNEWIAVRDVSHVNGEPLTDREDLRALLSRKDQVIVARELTWRNARFNIGRTRRTFNEPTLPLLLLDSRRAHRIRFQRQAVVRDGSTTLVTLTFEEREPPTLVNLEMGGSIKAKGEFLIDAGTGAVRRTLFTIKRDGIDIRLETVYALDEKLKLWLPSIFTERYDTQGGSRLGDGTLIEASERVECVARYSNYRRFDVTAKIK